MNSIDRVLAILTLFTQDQRVWTAEAIAKHFDVSVSQAYRYCKSLVRAGLLDPYSPMGYVLGPAFIEYERLLQISDPMISAARPIMLRLVNQVPPGSAVLVSKLYRSRVMCLDEIVDRTSQNAFSFERGRPMPLLWGATSKVILAHMSARDLARIHRLETDNAPHSSKTPTVAELRTELAEIKRLGYCVARAEVDAGRVGIAAPIFADKGAIIGSLTSGITEEMADSRTVRRLASLMMASAKEIEDAMANSVAPEHQESEARTYGCANTETGERP